MSVRWIATRTDDGSTRVHIPYDRIDGIGNGDYRIIRREIELRGFPAGTGVQLVRLTVKRSLGGTALLTKTITATTDAETVGRILDNGSTTNLAVVEIVLTHADTDIPGLARRCVFDGDLLTFDDEPFTVARGSLRITRTAGSLTPAGDTPVGSVVLSAPTTTLEPFDTVPFAAVVNDLSGNPFPRGVTYSIISGGSLGTLDPFTGVFTAANSGSSGAVVVRASAGGVLSNPITLTVLPYQAPLQSLAFSPAGAWGSVQTASRVYTVQRIGTNGLPTNKGGPLTIGTTDGTKVTVAQIGTGDTATVTIVGATGSANLTAHNADSSISAPPLTVTARAGATMIFGGHSLTAQTDIGVHAWPTILQSYFPATWGFHNIAVGGQTLRNMLNNFDTELAPLIDAALAADNFVQVFVWEQINQWLNYDGYSGSQWGHTYPLPRNQAGVDAILDLMAQYVAKCKARDTSGQNRIRVCVFSGTPGGWSGWEWARQRIQLGIAAGVGTLWDDFGEIDGVSVFNDPELGLAGGLGDDGVRPATATSNAGGIGFGLGGGPNYELALNVEGTGVHLTSNGACIVAGYAATVVERFVGISRKQVGFLEIQRLAANPTRATERQEYKVVAHSGADATTPVVDVLVAIDGNFDRIQSSFGVPTADASRGYQGDGGHTLGGGQDWAGPVSRILVTKNEPNSSGRVLIDEIKCWPHGYGAGTLAGITARSAMSTGAGRKNVLLDAFDTNYPNGTDYPVLQEYLSVLAYGRRAHNFAPYNDAGRPGVGDANIIGFFSALQLVTVDGAGRLIQVADFRGKSAPRALLTVPAGKIGPLVQVVDGRVRFVHDSANCMVRLTGLAAPVQNKPNTYLDFEWVCKSVAAGGTATGPIFRAYGADGMAEYAILADTANWRLRATAYNQDRVSVTSSTYDTGIPRLSTVGGDSVSRRAMLGSFGMAGTPPGGLTSGASLSFYDRGSAPAPNPLPAIDFAGGSSGTLNGSTPQPTTDLTIEIGNGIFEWSQLMLWQMTAAQQGNYDDVMHYSALQTFLGATEQA